ncbi:MAG: beta-propeller fold lactonase family protein [Thioploca sp.]|nr:beta-propeller fold lactonase family protein [Thioploca sp.]
MNKTIFIPLLLTVYLWLPSCLLTLPVSALADLSFYGFIQEGNGRIEGLDGANLVAASHDDKFVYVASMEDDAITVLIRNPTTGEVIPIQVIKISWFGELNNVSSMVVSADDQLVYVTSNQDDAVAVFQRDINMGQLNFVQQFLKDGQDGVDGLDGANSVAVSTDNQSVYVASNQDDAIAVFQRDINTGLLSFQQVLKDGQDNVDGLDGASFVTVSADNKSVYVTSHQNDAIAVFERDLNTGQLSFQQVLKDGQDNVDGLDGASSVAVSADNQSVYVTSNQDDAVAVFQRDTNTGQLSFQQVLKDGQDNVDGLNGASSVVVSANNQWVYVASYDDDAIAVFQRETSTGQLNFQYFIKDGQDGVKGLKGARSVAVGADDQLVYVASWDDSAIVLFQRDPSNGKLSLLQILRDSNDLNYNNGFAQASSIHVAPNNSVYVTGYKDDAVAYFDESNSYPDSSLSDFSIEIQSINENTSFTFEELRIYDDDAGIFPLQVTLTVTNGTLTLMNSKEGLSFTEGDGTADSRLVFTGTLTAINNALIGMTFTPTLNFGGEAIFEIKIDDLGHTGSGGARQDTDTLIIKVLPVNEPPVIETIAPQYGIPNKLLSFKVIATDPDVPKQDLTYQLIDDPPPGASIDSKTGQFKWIFSSTQVGIFELTVAVTDNGVNPNNLEASQTFEVIVTDVPILKPIGVQTVLVDNTLTFTAQADFPEAPALTFSLLNAPPGAQIDKKTGEFTWTPTQTGEFSVTVAVTEPFDQRTAKETVIITVTQIPTRLELTLSSMAIFQNGHLTAKGKLTSYPQQPAGLKELPIQLQITAPDGSITTLDVTTTASGEYHFTQLPVLTQTGQYQLQAQFANDDRLAASQSEPQTVLVSALAGYALLVQGRDAKGKGQETYGKSLNRVYQKLINRGFIDDNIDYLGYGQNQVGILVDDTPDKAKIQTALKTLLTRLNVDPAPLYIVMVDHGDLEGNFHLDNGNHEEIAPTELDTWLTALEQGLNDLAKAQPRVIIIGSCYSGNFTSALSKPGRILVTSTAPGEESYKGPKEPDEVRSGEYFIEALFAQLGQGYSLKTAFELATQSTELFTRADDTDFFNEQFQDNAVQHPLLDDNSDNQGSNVLEVDGQVAKTIYLGLGPQYDPTAPDSPAMILNVTPTLHLEANITSAPLWAQVNQPSRVKGEQVFVDIRPPSLQLTNNGIEQRETLAMEGLERIELGLASGNEFRGQFDDFIQIGRYELFYFVVDSDTGDRSLLQRSLVYKNRTGNQPPTPVQLRAPQNANETPTTVIFAWQPSSDPDNDPVTYTFLLATEPSMRQIIYRQEELRMTMTYLNSESVIADPLNQGQLGLRDGTEYAWQVQAVDKYGAMSESPVFTFQTNDTNLPPGLGSLYVYNAVDFVSLENAILDFWLTDEWGNLILDANGLPIPVPQPPELFQDQGFYNLTLPYGRRRATLHATGYQDQPVLIDTTDGLAQLRVAMTPVGGIPLQPGQLQLAAEQTRVDETQGQITLVVKRVGGDDGAVSVAYQGLPDGSASLGTDYHVEEGQLTWADQDSLPKKILVTLLDDNQKESDETFALRLNNPGGGATLGTPNTITITLLDDEAQQPLPPGTLPSQTPTYTEETGDIQLEEPIQTITDNEIIPTQPKENTVIVPPQPGDTTSPQTNPPTTDTPIVITSSESQAGILQFITNTYYLNEGIGSVSAFTVIRSGGNQGSVSVKYTTTIGTADMGIDYVGGTGLLTWADGDDMPKAIEIQIIDDSQSEGPETIQLQLINPTGNAQLGIDDHAILIIADNDTATAASSVSVLNSELNQNDIAVLQFESALHWSQEEDGGINLIITRTGSSQGEVAVNYLETLHSNATPGEDYLNGSGSLIWTDGDNQPKTITLNLIDDDFPEAEFIHLVLVEPLGQAVLGKQSETVIILQDQDEANPVQADITSIQLVKPIEIITESQNEVLIPVIRTGTQGYAAINYETIAGSATVDEDYLPRQGHLVWQDGEEGVVGLIIPIIADSQPEPEESFTLQLFNPSEGVQLGKLSQVEIRIQDSSHSTETQISPLLPNLGRGMAVVNDPTTSWPTRFNNCQAFPCPLNAAFRGGSSFNGLSYYQRLTLHPYQYVNIRGEIDVAAEHVGQTAELLVVAAWQPLDSLEPAHYFMQGEQGQILPWDLNLAHLVAAQAGVKLTPTQAVHLYTGFLASGQIRLFFGYQLPDGVIVFNGEQALELVVTELATD